MRRSCVAAIGALMLAAPATAQGNKPAPIALLPMPDTRGADLDFICYSALLFETSRMPAGQMREGVTATIGVYVERLDRKYPDAAGLNAAARGVFTAFDGHVDELAAFGRPCAQRAGFAMDRARDALDTLLPPATK